MIINNKCYSISFGEVIKLYFGNKLVATHKLTKEDSEIDVALNLIEKYKRGKAYNEWLKILRMISGEKTSLKSMKTKYSYNSFLSCLYAEALDELKEIIYNLDMKEIWRCYSL